MVEIVRRKKRRTSRGASGPHAATTAGSAALPGWSALSKVAPLRSSSKSAPLVTSITTARFVLWLFGIGVAATLYVGHVHATQRTFENLHALRKQNLQLHLERDHLRGQLDHATGPTIIYPKAYELGLKEGFDYGPSLKVHAE